MQVETLVGNGHQYLYQLTKPPTTPTTKPVTWSNKPMPGDKSLALNTDGLGRLTATVRPLGQRSEVLGESVQD